MSPTDLAVQEEQAHKGKQRVVNDFSLQVATVNGSGSQTANLVLLRSILLMGVPVSGKNMFPSNIAGLPTWYTIRASKRGYVGRKKEVDFLVAMNSETAKEDVLTLEPGAAVVYDEPLKLNALRNDLVFYPVPFDKLVTPVCPDAKLRRLVRNMIYDGILAKLLGIDPALMDKALQKQLGKKAKAVTLNANALKAGWDYAGLAYYAETPAVIFDVQRVGPSTGLPTRTAQGDLLMTAFLSHGDTKHIMIFPSSVEECYEMAQQAFELAEQFQTPVFVMMDLDLGMNNWMSDGFQYPDRPVNRGKLLTKDVLKRIGEWGRYKDVDGDGIAYRTVPGDGMPASFTRGSGHNAKGQYSERPDDYVENLDRLLRKFETARKWVPKPELDAVAGAKIGLIGYGTSHWAIAESRDQLREETDVKTSYFRLRAYPFTEELAAFIDAHERIYIVEQNRDAQLLQLMKLELSPERTAKLRSILHYNGLPIDARSVSDDVLAQEGYEVARKTARVAGAGMTGGE